MGNVKKWAALLLGLLFLLAAPARDFRPAGQTEPLDTAKYIALTFDDGPRASTTARLLDGLAERGVHATFFLIGEQIPGNEDLVARLAREGHQIGVHTFDHIRLADQDEETVREELERTEALLRLLVGEREWWLRPPYGLITPREAAWVSVPMVQWTIDPEDWRFKDARRVSDHIVSHAEPGAIILLHDIYPTSVDAALTAVDTLTDQGYTFVTVQDLFRAYDVEPRPGMLYMSPQRPMWPD